MSIGITRPNGSIYRPRKVRSQPLGNEDETTGIVVLGTHDLAEARSFAAHDLAVISEAWDYEIRIDPRDPGKRVWYRQTIGGWYEDSPLYLFVVDEERGAAGVEFDVLTEFDLDDLVLDEFDLPVTPAKTLCPECVQGKHSNCIETTLNDADEWVPCGCPEHGETR